MLEVKFYDQIEDELLEFAVIISKTNGKWVFCKHKERNTYEVPGGHREMGETIFETAQRELREETGAIAKNIFPLGELYPTPGYCGEIIWLFGATGLSFESQDLDEDEFLEVEKIPLEKAVEMIMKGEIKDAKTQTAILKLKLLKDNGKI